LDTAIDRNGSTFQVVEADRQVERGWCEESVMVMLAKAYLEKAASAGLDIKVIGKRGSVVVILPADYISEFMEKASRQIE
jgi:hypothetical protein